MISFRQKIFSNKELINRTARYIKDHPVLPLSAASLGIGVANYRTNTRRQREGVEQHKEQLKALNNLNSNITKNSEALNKLDQILKESNKVLGETNKKESTTKKKSRSGILSILKRKNYSIENGGFRGRKIEPSPSSISGGALVGGSIGALIGTAAGHSNPTGSTGIFALIGAGVGAGLGALVTWMSNIANKSIFNSGLSNNANSYTLCDYLDKYYREPEVSEEETVSSQKQVGNRQITTTTRRTTSTGSKINPVGTLYNIDSDPNKHVVNILLRGNVMVMLVNKPTSFELKKLNIVLDKYCSSYRLADYTSEKLGKDIYLVEINIVNNTEGSFVVSLINAGIKVNILTTDRFGIKNR